MVVGSAGLVFVPMGTTDEFDDSRVGWVFLYSESTRHHTAKPSVAKQITVMMAEAKGCLCPAAS